MKPDKQKSVELEQDWVVVSERFGRLAEHRLLAKVSNRGFSEAGRGAVTLFYLRGEPSVGYATRDQLLKQIHSSSFKDKLLASVNSYNPSTLMVVLVTFNDLAAEEDFCCHYFVLSIQS